MSTALRNVCITCLRSTLRSRRTPHTAAVLRLPRRAPLHTTTPRPLSAINITHQPVDDDILGTIGASVPVVEPLFKLPPKDIITLKEHLEAGDLAATYSHFMGIKIAIPTAEEVKTAYAQPETSMADYVSDTTLQTALGQFVAALLAADWKGAGTPHPLRLLERMEEMGVCKGEYYSMLLIETIRRYNTKGEILPVFDRAVGFSVAESNMHGVVLETMEPESVKMDMASPYFFAYLVLTRDLRVKEESTLRYEHVIRHSPYPSSNYAQRFMEYHKFSPEDTTRIVGLLGEYAEDTLFTNYYTLSLEISQAQAKSPEDLQELYKRMVSTSPRTPDVYTRFMTAFFELGRNTEAITCWADMTRAAIIPTVVQWNELLRAYSRSQDKLPIEPVWQMMIRSGCTPDHHCWTTRIHALLDNKKIAAGLGALREMQASGTTPTTATINATLDGLLKHSYINEAMAVMDTASRLGIEKDLVTYNTILKTLMKRQKTDTRTFNSILALTREMQASGIVPDITTVTLILDGMYKYATPAPKLETVLGILQYVEDAGIITNIVTFTTILHALLKEGNEPAAMGILGIMEDRGIVGNSTTYTVLLQHYFARGDVVSAERVIAEMEAKRVPTDARVYREIVLGFANAREARKMQFWLARIRDRHVVLGLLAYMSFLRAMERKELLLEAKNLVAELMERGMVGGGGEGMVNEREFWDVVREMAGGAVFRELEKEGRVHY
ncbi:uncharacterized protein LAJ45_03295 [Morchella importuna]|uniref:uncharacterized protein n=1 Tax=Morchella importuna TaxID=1174673 RepID=UPI001E8E4010|nr:uncharacterized protein LAJ45_03295 [Morchella importuna]KAH8152455.1 hypothetical protein LAJ45_03295 [Morchella importuna]